MDIALNEAAQQMLTVSNGTIQTRPERSRRQWTSVSTPLLAALHCCFCDPTNDFLKGFGDTLVSFSSFYSFRVPLLPQVSGLPTGGLFLPPPCNWSCKTVGDALFKKASKR